MNAKDLTILKLLQEDCTLSVKEIAEKIGLTFTPTYERIKQLEKSGVIKKYVALLDREKVGLGIVVYCNISMKEQSRQNAITFEETISKYNEVQDVVSISGDCDYMIKVIAKDIDSYNEFVMNVISEIPAVGKINSSIVLKEVKNCTQLKID